VAAVLHQVVVHDVRDDVVTELPLDEAHDPLPVANDVVLADHLGPGGEDRDLAPVGVLLGDRHEEVEVVAPDHRPRAVRHDPDAMADEEVAVGVPVAADEPVGAPEDDLAAGDEVPLKPLLLPGSAGGREAIARVADVLADGDRRVFQDAVVAEGGGRGLVGLQAQGRAGVEGAVFDHYAALARDLQIEGGVSRPLGPVVRGAAGQAA
jgi:hypothetical protein